MYSIAWKTKFKDSKSLILPMKNLGQRVASLCLCEDLSYGDLKSIRSGFLIPALPFPSTDALAILSSSQARGGPISKVIKLSHFWSYWRVEIYDWTLQLTWGTLRLGKTLCAQPWPWDDMWKCTIPDANVPSCNSVKLLGFPPCSSLSLSMEEVLCMTWAYICLLSEAQAFMRIKVTHFLFISPHAYNSHLWPTLQHNNNSTFTQQVLCKWL